MEQSKKTYGGENTERTLSIIFFVLLWPLFFPFYTVSQQHKDSMEGNKVRFSGFINLNTNGISPVPAFSLDKPSLVGYVSLVKGRVNFNPELGFSTEGKPWYIDPRLTYNVYHKEKFDFDLTGLYSFSFSYPESLVDEIVEITNQIDHYMLLQSSSNYRLSEKTSINLSTFHGFGLRDAPIRRGNFFILGAIVSQLKISEYWYYNLIPQITYINLDAETEGAFLSALFEIGHKNWPVLLSSQWVQALTTNISPSPGLKWNIGLAYYF